jgi:hypothetical protein
MRAWAKASRNPPRRRRDGGFSVVEVVTVAAMVATVLSTICVGVRSAHVASREKTRRAQLTLVCGEVMERLFHVPFGTKGDATATPAQLNELFDGDDDLGTATLCSLRVATGRPGFRFDLANVPVDGNFEVRVDGDRNGDGDLLRIELLHDGIPILESMRSASTGSP